jgi:hypothetical protein
VNPVNLWIGSCYDACLRSADWALAHRAAMLAIAAPLLTLAIIAINQLVLRDFPNSGDEYVYLYQAATMARGRLWNDLPPSPELFQFNYIVQAEDKVYGSFPIGWPLALAGAMRVGVPVWLVNPIAGTLSLVLIALLGTRLHNARVGLLAAALTAVSSFFLFNAASYFSHTFCGLLLLGAACLAAREDRSRAWVPLGVGWLVGWAVLARYFTGVACAVPIVLLLVRPGVPIVRTLGLVALGGLPWVAVLLVYNDALLGTPWQVTTTPLTRSLWFASGFALRGADILSTHLLRFYLWTPPLLVGVYAWYLAAGARDVRRGAIDWMLLFVAVPLYFYVERGGNQYGPRFYYEAFLFLVIFVTANLFREQTFADKPPRDRVVFGLMLASIAVMPLWFAMRAVTEHRVIVERSDPFRMVEEANLTNAIVLIGGRVGTERSMSATDLTRNGIDFTGSVLYGLDIGPQENCQLLAAFASRTPYLYVWDRAAGRGVLEPIVCERPRH